MPLKGIMRVLAWCCLVPRILPINVNRLEELKKENLQHRVVLDQEGKYLMLWTPEEDEIIIEIQVATLGYIAIGFSPTGGMKGADIVLAWVDDASGELKVHDRYALGTMVPMIDTKQDINVISGYQNDSHTVLRFSRPWNTCDEDHDLKLSGDTTRLIWSYSYEDPRGDMDMNIHDHRGSKSMYLREPRFELPTFSEDVKSIDFRFEDVELPGNIHTFYWCQIFKIPNLVGKNHLIGYIPIIKEGNHEQVHHMLMSECHLNESSIHYEEWINAGGRQCLGANMPPSWFYCRHTIIAWAIGSEGELFPEHVGLPIGEAYGGSDYYMLQMHYDNPKLKKGVIDDSGLRLFYTDKTREIDGGVLNIGAEVGPTMLIPPKQQWSITGICSDDCTKQAFPEDGIRVFQGLLHAHLLGRGITIKQIRNGIELPTVFKDMNYDFDYQQQRVLKEEMHILPGDMLIVECNYDARRKFKPTFGGDDTTDEMCLSFLTYYPRMDLSMCMSGPQLPSIYEPLGINGIREDREKYFLDHETNQASVDIERLKILDKKYFLKPSDDITELDISMRLKGVILKSPEEYLNKTLYDHLYDADTWKRYSKSLPELQNRTTYDPHFVVCGNVKGTQLTGVLQEIQYPDFIAFKSMEDEECSSTQKNEVFVAYERPEISESKSEKSEESESDSGSNVLGVPTLLTIIILRILQVALT